MNKVYSFNGYTIFLRDDGIIQLTTLGSFYGELEDVINMHAVFKEIAGDKRLPVLVMSSEDTLMSREARDYIGSDEVSKVVLADAFVIHSVAQKLLINMYLKINKPNRPTRFFKHESEALAWIKENFTF